MGWFILSVTLVLTAQSPLLAGAWIRKDSISITRGAVNNGKYPVTICFKVQRSARDIGPPQTLSTNILVMEVDWWNQTVANRKINVQIPHPGTIGPEQCFEFSYPCDWGDEIWFEVENRQGFLGASSSQEFFTFSPGTGSHALPAGELGLSGEVTEDPILLGFFTSEEESPLVPVGRGFDADTGDSVLGFNTGSLLDPAPLGYEAYELEIFRDEELLSSFPIAAVDRIGDPEVMPDPLMMFGEPVRLVSVSDKTLDLDAPTHAAIVMFDVDSGQPPVVVYAGSLDLPGPHEIARFGSTSSSGSAPYDVLWINDDRGDEYRHLAVETGAPLTISMRAFPGADVVVPFVLWVHGRENHEADVTLHPKGLGIGAFATPLAGGNPITLLNTIGKENRLGTPKISDTPHGPGVLLELPSTPASLAGRSLTFQAIVADTMAPNGIAAFSNAIVTNFSE